jgi:hypothetical protein
MGGPPIAGERSGGAKTTHDSLPVRPEQFGAGQDVFDALVRRSTASIPYLQGH